MTEQKTFRYDDVDPDLSLEVLEAPEGQREAIETHLEAHLGPCENVYHELISAKVHLDLLIFPPTEERPCYTVVTLGISDGPLATPEEAKAFTWLELMVQLPPEWRFDFDELPEEERERWFWPLRLLKKLGRFVQAYKTFFAVGHTIPNGDPMEPYADNTQLACALLLPPVEPEELDELTIDDRVIRFLQIVPITERESELKLAKGAESLLKMLEITGSVSPVIRPNRPCAFSVLEGDMEPVDLAVERVETEANLAHFRANATEEIFEEVRLEPPAWIPETDSPLGCLYKDQRMLLEQGQLAWAHIVQANSLLFQSGKDDCPAAIVYSLDPNVQMKTLVAAAETLFDTKETNPEDPELTRFAEVITGETETLFNVPVPGKLTDGVACYYTTVMVHRAHLPVPVLGMPFFPVLVDPDRTEAAMILPGPLWSETLESYFSTQGKLALVNEEDEDESDGSGCTCIGVILLLLSLAGIAISLYGCK